MSNVTSMEKAKDDGRAAGRAAGFAEGRKEGLKIGAQEEKDRWKAIVHSEEAVTRPLAAVAAANTGMAADAALALLAKLPEEKPLSRAELALRSAGFKPANGNVIDFQSAMNNSNNPELGVFGGEPEKLSRADRAMADAGFKRKQPNRE